MPEWKSFTFGEDGHTLAPSRAPLSPLRSIKPAMELR